MLFLITLIIIKLHYFFINLKKIWILVLLILKEKIQVQILNSNR